MNVNSSGLNTRSIARLLILFVIPIWLGTFFQQLYNTVDAIFVGRYVGDSALAAVGGPCAQIVNLLIGVFVELAAGSSVIIAQYFGANNAKNIGKAIHTAVSIALISGVVLTAVGLIAAPALLRSMDAEGEVYAYGRTYLTIYFSGTIFITVYNLGSAVLRALGDSKHPFYFLVISCLTNIALVFLLIKYLKMGVAGAGIATVASQALSAVLVIRQLRRLPAEYRLHFRKIWIHTPILKRMLSIGVPEAMQQVMYSLSNIIIQTKIDGFGTNTIAAMSAYSKVDAFFWMTMESFGIAITAMAGQYYGAGKINGVKRSTRICLVMCFFAALILGTAILLLGRPLFGLFTDNTHVIEIALSIQHTLVPCYMVYIFVSILAGSLRGMGHSFIPMFITLAGICLLRVVWLYGVQPMNPTLMMTIVSYPVTWTVTSLAFIIYYRRTLKKEEKLSPRTA